MLLEILLQIWPTIVLQVLQVCHMSAMPTMAMAPLVMPLEGPAPEEEEIVFSHPLLKAGGKEEAAKIRKFQKFWKILGTVRKVTTSTSSVYSNLYRPIWRLHRQILCFAGR